MFLKRRSRVTSFLVLMLATTLAAQNSSKRPITHKDYDSFKSITSQKLSDDGKLLAYILSPQEGDSEVVLRNLETGVERREPMGSRPQATNTASEGEPVAAEPGRPAGPGAAGARVAALSFTSDGKYLVFTANPPKADTDKARKEKKKPEEMPKPSLVIVPTAGGDAVRIDNVRGFQVAENNANWLAYQKGSLTPTDIPQREDAQDEDQGRARGAAAAPAANRREYGSELVLRNLSNQSERQFADVLEYLLSKDGATLAYAVSSKKEENNGVYAAATDGSESKALASGKGRYLRLAWDDTQKQLAFVSSKDDASSRQAKFKLYYWSRGSNVADAVVAPDTAGFRSGWVIADRGVVNFSKDGERLYFATAPQRAERRPDPDAMEEKVVADLWHWKDDNVQPMQKVRAEQDRTRSYRAAYVIASKQVVQLSDLTMQDVTFSDNSKLGIGTDDRDYRAMVEYDERHSDYYLVDTATGARTLVGRNLRGAMSSSPDSKWGVHFNGRDWISYEFAMGKQRNLTEGIGVAFYNEEHDTPGTRTSHGTAGWTKDSKYVLLNDRYDIWQMSPDGSSSKLLTDGVGRREKIQFRYVRFGEERTFGGFGGPDRGGAVIDSTKPLVLRAENLETRDTGFWEDRIDSNDPPKKLIMAAKAFTTPAKAKNADVVVLTATRFDEFGDLLVTDSKFSKLKKVSDANPQMKQMAWGTGELINFRNTDGTPLKAALYKPENFDPSKKYPMIVYIYERLSQSLHTFRAPAPATSINITYYTSNGYLVLTPDIAYNIGYPGQSAMKCVLPAVQSVVDKGFVDENAIGIQGHSWGGYQIAYMITQTNRFRAVAAGAPVANMTSAYDGIRWGTGLPRQFQYERTQSRIGGSLWEYPLRFLENSPIFQADRVKTPVLMVHNDGDDAVPWYQGIEYFLALRRLGKEAYLFNYNGEPHGLRKRINQKDYTMRMQQFFDHFLKGAPMPAWMERGIPYIDRETEKEQYRKPVEPQATGGGAQ